MVILNCRPLYHLIVLLCRAGGLIDAAGWGGRVHAERTALFALVA